MITNVRNPALPGIPQPARSRICARAKVQLPPGLGAPTITLLFPNAAETRMTARLISRAVDQREWRRGLGLRARWLDSGEAVSIAIAQARGLHFVPDDEQALVAYTALTGRPPVRRLSRKNTSTSQRSLARTGACKRSLPLAQHARDTDQICPQDAGPPCTQSGRRVSPTSATLCSWIRLAERRPSTPDHEPKPLKSLVLRSRPALLHEYSEGAGPLRAVWYCARSAPHGVRPGRGGRPASGSVCGPEAGVAPPGAVLATGVYPGLGS
jgi:hypothetical protein